METVVGIHDLQESKTNPRKSYDKSELSELTASIKEKGIITPILVRPLDHNETFEIVAGSRRYRAAKAAGLKEVPVLVKELTDEEALEIQIIENDQRSDVHPLEQAEAYARLRKQGNLTIEQIATRMGRSPSYVAQRLKLMDLIEPIRKKVLGGKVSMTNAYQAARLLPAQQKEAMRWIEWHAGEFAHKIQEMFFLILSQAPFDFTDATLVPKAGSCVDCPKRTGFNAGLFPDVKNENTCTDPVCFEEKTRAQVKRQVGTHPDAVLLTVCAHYDKPQNPKGAVQWTPTKGKSCPDTKQGIVVEVLNDYSTQSDKAKPGQLLSICDNLKCKTHFSVREQSTGDNGRKEFTAKMRIRKIDLRRRGILFNNLATKWFSVNDADNRSILDWAIHSLSHDDAKAVCDAMGWEAQKKYDSRDHQGAIRKNLSKLPPVQVERWIFLLMLAEKELWYHSGGAVKAALLEAKAKHEGINLAAIAKQAKERPAKKAKAKPEPERKTANKGKYLGAPRKD